MTHEAPEDMGSGGTERPETEWTAEERAALDGLASEIDPGTALEDRTVRALRGRGLLAGRAADGGRRRGPAWWAAGIAAALALFLSGAVVGQWRAEAAARDLVVALRAADAAERAALVQRTGSLWVEALAGLADLQARGEDEEVATGAEVARAALHAAAVELARLHPADARYARILEALEEPGQAAGGEGRPVTQVLWF